MAFLSLSRVYSTFKNKLNKLKNAGEEPVLFFYLSQLYCYIDIATRNTVIQYIKYDKKVSRNTLEINEEVDYSDSIDEYIGHSSNDFGKKILNDGEVDKNPYSAFIDEMIDKNGELYVHNHLDSYVLDKTLENKQDEINLNSLSKILENHFNEEEINIIKDIYTGSIGEATNIKKEMTEKIGIIREKIENNKELKEKVMSFLTGDIK